MHACLIALGSNLGDRRENLAEALSRLARHPQIKQLAASPPYATLPIGGPSGQQCFLNAAARFETSLAPHAIYQFMKEIEVELGRVPATRWAPRIVDLDLLLFNSDCLASPQLTVPHPRMSCRRFVLEPAAEIAGSMLHSTSGYTVHELLTRTEQRPLKIAVVASQASAAKALTDSVRERLGTQAAEIQFLPGERPPPPRECTLVAALQYDALRCVQPASEPQAPVIWLPQHELSQAEAELLAAAEALIERPQRLPDEDIWPPRGDTH